MTLQQQTCTLANSLPDEQASEVLTFIEALRLSKQSPTYPKSPLPKGTLTGLRGIAKQSSTSDEAISNDYTDYLTQEYQ
jgi:hypothetical protein